jgi:ankyrin repeat protein
LYNSGQIIVTICDNTDAKINTNKNTNIEFCRLIDSGLVNKNCVDPMGRTALVNAIINEDLPMVKLLISAGVEAQDALLHAISKEFVEAVDFLLHHEESVTQAGQKNVRASHFYLHSFYNKA